MKTIRDRIVELRRVRAGDLRRHPHNWRIHPSKQRSALARVLNEIGYADALVARALPDGSLELIDGHLRAATTPDLEVPVLVVDLDEREAALLLAVHDPLTEMAERNDTIFETLLSQCGMDHTAIDRVIRSIHGEQHDEVEIDDSADSQPKWDSVFQVVIDCEDEQRQRETFERLTAEGLRCRVLTL